MRCWSSITWSQLFSLGILAVALPAVVLEEAVDVDGHLKPPPCLRTSFFTRWPLAS